MDEIKDQEEKLPLTPSLNAKQIDISRRLNDFYNKNKFKPVKPSPSEIFQGAVFGMQKPLRSNPDWMSQVANSLRELLYPIWYEVRRHSRKDKSPLIKNTFKKYGSVFIEEVFDDINEVYGKLNDITHHGLDPQVFTEDQLRSFTDDDFDKLVGRFEDLILRAFTLTLDIFEQIDSLFYKTPTEYQDQYVLEQEIKKLIKEKSAGEYFFYKADENWLDWLWRNGFIDAIKQKAKDPTGYGYRSPELNYLVRMAGKKPKEVADIILSVSISKDNFNPESVAQFLRICSSLPAEQLTRLVSKIRDENWVQLMGVFDQWGFDYEKIFQTLATAKEYGSILILAEAVLAVKTKEEYKQTSHGYSSDNPFYFSDFSYTKVFEHLVAVGNQYLEKALELTAKVMATIVHLGENSEENEVFPIRDTFYLFDVDFFSLELGDEKDHSKRENIKDLAATIKALAQRLIGDNCDNSELVRGVYKKYIQTLPESKLMWRLRLFVLSLCPTAFRTELKESFSKLFEVMKAGKHYYEIESGTEYKKTLKRGFGVLDSDYQREYVSNVFKYFGKSREDKEEEQGYRLDGWQILSSIDDFLTQKEKEECEKVFGKKCDPAFEPEPFGKVVSGLIEPRAAISQEEFGNLPVTEIAKKLRDDWNPEALRKQNASDDFLNPLNAEGVGKQLRGDIARRLQDYIQNANLFFERDVLDEHYTYSFFLGIQEAIRADKTKATDIQWDKLIEVFIAIKNSGIAKAFDHKIREREKFDSWLSGWNGVHSAMTDVLRELLSENEGKTILDFPKYRSQLFEIISYLLAYPDPQPQDEEIETATIKTHSPGGKQGYYVSDPFTMAINSVRGRAFQAFVLFAYQDGKQFKKDDKIKIAEDVKKLYEGILKKENTRALMFMFGHYLPSFYFLDKDWIHTLLPQIFPEDSVKKHLYLAAWEGYLANNLYEEIFFDSEFQKLYERGLNLTGNEDQKRCLLYTSPSPRD